MADSTTTTVPTDQTSVEYLKYLVQKQGWIVAAGAVAVVVTMVGCDNSPLPGSAPGYPCGVFGVVCSAQHSCCDEGDTCGGEPASVGCPAGECCYVGADADNDNLARRRPKQHPQRPMQ